MKIILLEKVEKLGSLGDQVEVKNGYARNYSGVSLDSFVKKITFQNLSEEGIKNLGPAIEKMAAAEQLQAHKNAVSIRLEKLSK